MKMTSRSSGARSPVILVQVQSELDPSMGSTHGFCTSAMLRPFLESDVEQCVEIFVSTFAQPPWLETWQKHTVRARLDQILGTPLSFGAVIGEPKITGFALGFSEPWHEGTHFYLKEMCIDHSHQRQGLGTKLMAYLSTELIKRDTRRIYLLTARGDRSEAFYSKIGFYTSPKMILMARRFEPNGAHSLP